MIYDGFYDAKTARDISIAGRASDNDVLTEINALQIAIDGAASTSNLYVVLDSSSSSVMTSSDLYYNAITDTSSQDDVTVNTYRVARAKMDSVIKYFTLLGFSIKRELDAINSRIKWNIRW